MFAYVCVSECVRVCASLFQSCLFMCNLDYYKMADIMKYFECDYYYVRDFIREIICLCSSKNYMLQPYRIELSSKTFDIFVIMFSSGLFSAQL
jgi:hypothetical protein